MNRASQIIMAMALFACTGTLHAQEANPISANMKQSWTNIRDLLVKMTDKMPEENYRFKPTPEIQDFGQRMAHAITFNMRACALLKGDQNTLMFSAAPTKAEVVAGMKQANDECDALFNSLTDAALMKTVAAGRGGQRLELAVLQGNVLEHAQEVYGYMCVYLRLKGIVPPSSDRNER
jgi:DinB superfamily